MNPLFPLTPRYRLDDDLPWLKGIDPSRHYWIHVNGDQNLTAIIPGLIVTSASEFKQTLLKWRGLQPGEQMKIERAAGGCIIHCISQNCYAIADELEGAPVWHLFDRETVESLLMTSHPDWKCSPKDVALGREMLARSFQLSAKA